MGSVSSLFLTMKALIIGMQQDITSSKSGSSV